MVQPSSPARMVQRSSPARMVQRRPARMEQRSQHLTMRRARTPQHKTPVLLVVRAVGTHRPHRAVTRRLRAAWDTLLGRPVGTRLARLADTQPLRRPGIVPGRQVCTRQLRARGGGCISKPLARLVSHLECALCATDCLLPCVVCLCVSVSRWRGFSCASIVPLRASDDPPMQFPPGRMEFLAAPSPSSTMPSPLLYRMRTSQ